MYFHTFVMLRVSRLLALGKLQGQGLTQDWKFPHSLLEDVLKQEAKKPSFINKKKKKQKVSENPCLKVLFESENANESYYPQTALLRSYIKATYLLRCTNSM